MKGFEYGKGTVRCGFCGLSGHNRTSCQTVNVIYDIYISKVACQGASYKPTPTEKKAIREMVRREKASTAKKQPRKKPRCSFCNSVKHKRNRCPKLAKFKKKVAKANENWRRLFAKEIKETGFGIGSLVTIPMGMVSSYGNYGHFSEPAIGIISNFDKNKLNVFCAYDGLEFSSVASAEVLVEGQVMKCMLSRLKAKFSDGMFKPKSAWQYYEVISVSSSNENIPEEWFTDSVEDEAMEWFFKNISQKYRNFKKLDSLITKWANRT